MTDKQPDALRLADALDKYADVDFDNDFVPAAAELRRVYNDADSLCAALNNASMELAKVRAENEALRADAERYRWLRQFPNNISFAVYGPTEGLLRRDEYLDIAIDSAMKGTQ